MKKLLTVLILSAAFISAGAQNALEVRARGGVNIQNSKIADKDVSVFPHFGLSAGIRISTFGIYGEMLYSVHEDINGGGEADYLIPSVSFRLYTYRFVYAEAGLSYLMLTKDPGGMIENVDKEAGYFVGLGLTLRKFELGFRTASQPVTNIQITASYRF
jgi:hypothetical protein